MLILIKGAGDLASGIALRLWRSGFSVIMTEISKPTVIRRSVSFADAVYGETVTVEGVTASRATDDLDAKRILAKGMIPVLVDPEAHWGLKLKPKVIVDAVLAKKNIGTYRNQAPLVIGCGPGFSAGEDVDLVIETKRGHYLGRVIRAGSAIPNTGIPGEIESYSQERVLRASADGIFEGLCEIGDNVEQGQIVGRVNNEPVYAGIGGVLRGLLRTGLTVHQGMKIGDVDPRGEQDYCFTVSEKALAIGGGILEAILGFLVQNNEQGGASSWIG